MEIERQFNLILQIKRPNPLLETKYGYFYAKKKMFLKYMNFNISKTAKTDTVWFADWKFPKHYNKLNNLVVLRGIPGRLFYSVKRKLTLPCLPLTPPPLFFFKEQEYGNHPQNCKPKYANVPKRSEDIGRRYRMCEAFSIFDQKGWIAWSMWGGIGRVQQTVKLY